MIVAQLMSDDIVSNWELIKYAIVTVNNITDDIEEYCNNVLVSLLSGKFQCWLGITDDRESVMGVAITRPYKDLGDSHYLLIDSLYVYQTTSFRDRVAFMSTIGEFAKQTKCTKILFYTTNQSIIDVANKLGFSESHKVFVADIGG